RVPCRVGGARCRGALRVILRTVISVSAGGPGGGVGAVRRSARLPSMQTQISRQDAWDLLCEWTESDSLRRHMLAVEAAMRGYAPRFDGDGGRWGLTGLLHDLDYERHPNLEDGHPRHALRELQARGH